MLGKTPSQQPKILDLKIFSDRELPHAIPPQDAIFIIGQNVSDGLGDYAHMINFGKEIKKIANAKGYKVYLLIDTMILTNEPADSAANKRAKFVKDNLAALESSGESPFERYFIAEMTPTSNKNQWFEEQADLKELLGHSASVLEISYTSSFEDIVQANVPAGVRVVKCLELGDNIYQGKMQLDKVGHIFSANMGLPDFEDPINASFFYGMKLKKEWQPLSEKEKVDHLLNKFDNKKFVQQLLSTSTPTSEDAETYLNSRKMIPAYVQTRAVATSLIMSQIYANIQDGQLSKGLDFHFPRDMIDEELLTDFIKELGLDVQFIKGDDPIVKGDPAKIRIFHGYRLEDNDYDFIYRLGGNDSVAGCSGDNSIEMAFSSQNLPFFQNKIGGQLSCFFDSLSTVVDNYSANFVDEESRESFYKLKTYFQMLANFENYFSYTLKDEYGYEMQKFCFPQKLEDDSFETQHDQLITHKEKLLTWCQTVAKYQSDPEMQEAWQKFRTHLYEHYNFNDNFPSILKGALYLSKPLEQEIIEAILETDDYKDLVDERILSFDGQYTLEMLLVVRKQSIKDALLRGTTTPEEIQEFLEKIPSHFELNSYPYFINSFLQQKEALKSQEAKTQEHHTSSAEQNLPPKAPKPSKPTAAEIKDKLRRQKLLAQYENTQKPKYLKTRNPPSNTSARRHKPKKSK